MPRSVMWGQESENKEAEELDRNHQDERSAMMERSRRRRRTITIDLEGIYILITYKVGPGYLCLDYPTGVD